MADNFRYIDNKCFENNEDIDIYSVNKEKRRMKTYSYEEAINIAGNGRYNVGLLATTSISILAMSLDMFGFSVVVSGSACEFQLDDSKKKILMSMPLLGAIIMSYPWGYISDTRGRRMSLLISMCGGFVSAILCALSPNWIILAVLKFFSTSFHTYLEIISHLITVILFSCTCAQSATYALLGESCPDEVKDFYTFIMTSILNLSFPIYVALGYLSLKFDFAYDLGFITLTSWRVLTVTLALPLGISGLALLAFNESPKFLLNAGKVAEALEALQDIWRRNERSGKKYPVEILASIENSKVSNNEPLHRSLWEQTAPLFRMPLLVRTLQLYFITGIIYSTTNSLLVWFPFLSNAFITGITSSSGEEWAEGLCNIITNSQRMNVTNAAISCIPKTDMAIVWSSLAQGVTFVIISVAISKLAYKRRALMISILIISGLASVGAAAVASNVASLIMFFVIFLCILATGILFSYFVALYPTSYRGMAACLATMMARASGLAGVNLVGTYILSNCNVTFYVIAANFFCAVVVSYFLPPDSVK